MVDLGLPVSEGDEAEPLGGREIAKGEAPPSVMPPSSKLGERLARLNPSARALPVLGLFLMCVVAGLYIARVVFIPLTFALMLSFFLSPVVTWLQHRRVPRGAGAALVVGVLLAAGSVAGVELASPAADWIARS